MSESHNSNNLQTLSGILLFVSATLAIIIANSSLESYYHLFFHSFVKLGFSNFQINQSLLHWINDGLMTFYFLLIGLEIKHEIRRGVFKNRKNILIPCITAICGIIVPTIIYLIFNYNHPINLKGWAIPTATDIAFTLGIIALLKSRVPLVLKVLITAIAIFDDIGAIAIIGFFYTDHLSINALILVFACTGILFIFNYTGIRKISLYLLVGFAIWLGVLQSGLHSTLAGIIIAMAIPDEQNHSTLLRLTKNLTPLITFLILPLFAFANAGISFKANAIGNLINPIVLGITFGLFIGKQIGIFLPLWFFVKNDHKLKHEITLRQTYGAAVICGVGFTMSLFIGSLAFQENDYINFVKMGVIFGSTLSAVAGYFILKTKKSISSTTLEDQPSIILDTKELKT